MTYLSLALLVVAPVALGALAAAVRRPAPAAHGLAALAMAAVLAGVLLTAPATALTIGNTDLDLTAIGRLELGFVAAVGALIVGYHFLSRRHSALPLLLPLIVAAVAAGRTFGPGLLVAASFLLLAAILTSVLMIGEQPDWQAGVAGAVYLTLSALGGMALLFGFVLADLQRLSPGGLVTVPFVVAVLSIGFALQWGVAPLYFWLPNAYQRAGPAAGAVAVCLVGPATLGLLIQALSALPQLVVDETVMRYLLLGGLGTAAFGAVAALAPGKLRRTLGYVLVADLGYVVAGMASLTRIGLTGATLHMAHRSLTALLLLAAAAELERVDRGATDGDRPAPYLWAILLVGSLALVGVPPLSGFAADWAVFQALSLTDVRLVVAMATTSIVCLAAILTALGRLRRSYPRPWRRPRAVEVALMLGAAFVALWGLVPGPAFDAIFRAAGALPFLKPL
ncbi:MAG TPA: proton-conducting transporter membrane subunit [Chloroflexota bacterium]|nr:proton-conducting transporter membrane subunit [Chloroflexota bacterium]